MVRKLDEIKGVQDVIYVYGSCVGEFPELAKSFNNRRFVPIMETTDAFLLKYRISHFPASIIARNENELMLTLGSLK